MRAARLAGRALVAGLVAMLALHVAWIARHVDSLRPLSGGAAAPAVPLPLLGGGAVALGGRPLVLDFWATWCPPCREELPALDRIARRLAGRAEVVAVNVEGPEAEAAVRAFVADTKLGLPVALGGQEAAAAYRVDTLPQLVIVDAAGRVRQVIVGARAEAELQAAIESSL